MGSPVQQESQNTFGRETVQTRKRSVTSGAQTLTTAQSGTLCLFDTAAGYTYTLPAITANTVGTWFEFFTTVSCTSVAQKIITDAGTTFLLGEVLMYTTATASPAGFAFNGTTHVACTMAGTTTGGLIGTKVRVVAISPTQWMIAGNIVGSGTIITPAATS
jgi:hypothetical protein